MSNNTTAVIASIAKITVLSTISLIVTQIMLIWLIIMTITKDYSSWSLWIGYLPIRTIINTFCVVLTFDFMSSWYLTFCKKFDRCCLRCCFQISKKKLQTSIINLI